MRSFFVSKLPTNISHCGEAILMPACCVLTHLFVGGHDPLDGVGSWGQKVTGGGESLRPLAHQHLCLTICCFYMIRQKGTNTSQKKQWDDAIDILTDVTDVSLPFKPIHTTFSHLSLWAWRYHRDDIFKYSQWQQDGGTVVKLISKLRDSARVEFLCNCHVGRCEWEAATVFTHANQLLFDEETVAVGLEMLMILNVCYEIC